MEGRYKPRPPWLCFSCALTKSLEHMQAMHDGTSPHLGKAIVAGRSAGTQIAMRTGPIYEKWKEGMAKSAEKAVANYEAAMERRGPPPT